MNKTQVKLAKYFQNNNIYKILVISLFAVFVVLGLYFSLFAPAEKEPAMEAIEGYDDNVLIIDDRYVGQRDIPKFNIEVNEYDPELFEVKNNQVYYPDAKFGIDVSSHQGEIDWEKVKAAGVDFAIIRCGYAEDKPEYDDRWWEYNATECERLGIPYGVYLYSYAECVEDAFFYGVCWALEHLQ